MLLTASRTCLGILRTVRTPVRLEFVVRPPLGAGPSPGSGDPTDIVQLGTGHRVAASEDGSKRVLKPLVFDSLKWAALIVRMLK